VGGERRGRVLGGVGAGGDHESNRSPDVAQESGGKGGLQTRVGAGAGALTEPHRNAADRAEIVGGDHGRDAGKRARRSGADGGDPRVRMGRPQHGGVEESGQPNGGGGLPASGQGAGGFFLFD